MIKIFICEDQVMQLRKLTNMIKNYILMENLDMEVVVSTPNPYELLKYVAENNTTDGLYFLDIDLATDITGIELAVKIRNHDKRGMIVFVTADKKSIKLTYKYHVEAIGYVSKEDIRNMTEEIKRCIDIAQERLVENKERMFVFKIAGKISGEPYKEILYFEKSVNNKNKTVMVTNKGSFEFYMTLKEIENVHESFHRVGGSYVFNMDNVKSFLKNECKVTMKNGLECFIPYKQATAFAKMMEDVMP